MGSEGPGPSEIRDRIEAIRRASGYKKDYIEWRRLIMRVKQSKKKTITDDLKSLNAHEIVMRKRWKLHTPFPPLPETPLGKWDRPRGSNPLDDVRIITVINPFDNNRQTIIGDLVSGYDPLWLEADYESFRGRVGKGKMRYKGGKHLCMIVDVTRTERELSREVKGFLKYYQTMLPKNKIHRRKPMTVIDIWQVYDLAHKGHSVKEIANQLLTSAPHVSNPYGATYNAVRRALTKTTRMVTELQ